MQTVIMTKTLFESFNDDNYFADAELNDLSGLDDDNSTLDCLERRIHSRQTKQKIKTTRKTRTKQLAFLSHRIHFSLREIFNARQFIKQAEDEIKENGGDNLNAIDRARETYYNLHRVISDETIRECMAVTKGIKQRRQKSLMLKFILLGTQMMFKKSLHFSLYVYV